MKQLLVSGVLALLAAGSVLAQQSQTDSANSETPQVQPGDPVAMAASEIRRSNYLPFPIPQSMDLLPGSQGWQPNTVMAPFPREYRLAMAQAGMAASPWSMRQMFNFMAAKIKAKKGMSFDQVIEAMDSRAVEVNFKKVGHTRISTELAAKLGKAVPKLEVLQYCDALVARKILDYSPEFSVFLPCRISVLEDSKGDIWVMTLDWDVTWLNYAWHPDSQLDAQLKQDAKRIRDAMHSIMAAGASGDW